MKSSGRPPRNLGRSLPPPLHSPPPSSSPGKPAEPLGQEGWEKLKSDVSEGGGVGVALKDKRMFTDIAVGLLS